MSKFLEISREVLSAIENRQPVVALESTIISHGMPWPQNVETAKAVEQVVIDNGAIPATIAIMHGKCYVGLSAEQLEFFGQERSVWKVSLRDMPYVISQQLFGATTVAATMRIASMAGINIFSTGGIGGVHRGAENNMDISADLTEMAQTNVAVVSAGIKSILDIGLTLEYMETMGIPVVTYGQEMFPSFYSSESKFKSPLSLNNVTEIAAMLNTKWQLGLNGSVLIANPLPADMHIPEDEIEVYIQEALTAAVENEIAGKHITPFLLKHIADNTQGESLQANIALIKNNAALAAKIAVELAAPSNSPNGGES